jgi:galactose-1-phosphate uridylyltransferase
LSAPSPNPKTVVNDASAGDRPPDCLACQILTGQIAVPGGTIAETPDWIADHCIGQHGLGAIVVKSRAHRENFWDLTPQEAATLGGFLKKITQAMQMAWGQNAFTSILGSISPLTMCISSYSPAIWIKTKRN